MASTASGAVWNPNALCDGSRAEDRSIWLQKNKNMSSDAARKRVIEEFPSIFKIKVDEQTKNCGPTWNPNAMCDGSRAEDRSTWLQTNKKMSIDAARQKVMKEFPSMFKRRVDERPEDSGPMWNPNAMCDGSRAEDRSLWLQKNSNLNIHAARQKVMNEFPSVFKRGGDECPKGSGPMWNPNTVCDGSSAEDRSLWLQKNSNMNVDAARIKVMNEFPSMFKRGVDDHLKSSGSTWNPNAMCDGSRAEERSIWLQKNKDMSIDAARKKVMNEFPSVLNSGSTSTRRESNKKSEIFPPTSFRSLKPLPHVPAAYLGADVKQSLMAFRDNGFLILPNVIPRGLIEQITSLSDMQGSGRLMDLFYNTPVFDIITLLLGSDFVRPNNCQVAKVMPRMGGEALERAWTPTDAHIDGLYTPDSGVPRGAVRNFSLLVGVPLTATPSPFMGNFGVFPGSHLRLQDGFRKEGIDALRGDVADWKSALRRMTSLDSEAPLPLCVNLGQAYIAHYHTVHFAQPNFRGTEPRVVIYFRIYAKGHTNWEAGDPASMVDIWKGFPIFNDM